MLYSLPNGKVIYLTLEEYLELTDLDIQYLMSINHGESIQNPWHGSSISKFSPAEENPNDLDYQEQEIIDHHDLGLDLLPDDYIIDFDIDFNNEIDID
jgi:hypothetical protein